MTRGLRERLMVTEIGPDRFEGHGAAIPARIYGGEIAAQALESANCTVDLDRSAHVVQCTYLRGGDPDVPLTYSVERVRDGRRYSAREVRASQRGRDVFRAFIGYSVEETGIEHQVAPLDVPGPSGLPTLAEAAHSTRKAWSDWQAAHPDYEMRVVPTDPQDLTGRRRFWCRFLFEEPVPLRHGVLALYSSDYTMISSVRVPHEPDDRKTLFMTTLNHTLYLHRSFDASGWHLVDHSSPVAFGGRGISIAHVYAPDGTMVATAVQEGLASSLA